MAAMRSLASASSLLRSRNNTNNNNYTNNSNNGNGTTTKRANTLKENALWHGIRVRIGIHYGIGDIRKDPVTRSYDYYGTVVNTAARVEGVGHGGQILISYPVYTAVLQKNGLFFTTRASPISFGAGKGAIPRQTALSRSR